MIFVNKSQFWVLLVFVISFAGAAQDTLFPDEDWIKVPLPISGVNDLYGSDEVDIMTYELMDSLRKGI